MRFRANWLQISRDIALWLAILLVIPFEIHYFLVLRRSFPSFFAVFPVQNVEILRVFKESRVSF